ncbi:stalk domain-containing protein [Pseudobacteroides cellulosolvens]|uniref:Copper amine oxidase-like domain-containing protein n=1 Tax=Pseudobacteroides cellulosolvens ATCC 35603 = DSM 2933 TaxID=398512 RepID=A0A0L6JX41_9FIRM|nr:stalk domain-containing protein [Pseudobacteroides cellulosolvens]KNY30165.1 copper amine oxidase-like domain-containing protein [Pseudobacteroides cellulosolvens ATCC 35603 = DSM 2933]
MNITRIMDIKKRIFAFVMVLVFCVSFSAAGAEEKIKIVINNNQLKIDVDPYVENGRTLVPMRAVFESLGATVSWDGESRTVTGIKGSTTVVLKIDVVQAYVNSEVKVLDVPAQIKDGRTFVPIRFISESLGAKVNWDGANRTISIEETITQTTLLIDGKYRKIEVDGGDIRGNREKLVVVDVGYGDREYWAYTNEYGQLIKVTAKQIIPQNQSKEPVLANGRYFKDEAKVLGTEREDLDEGHVIADSLGGVSNAYNITPQNSVLNRYGDQAYMEKVIRDAGGCTDFIAIITYPDTKTQIPSHYSFKYTLKGNVIQDEFDNVNPDVVNQTLNKTTTPTIKPTPTTKPNISTTSDNDISRIDTNNNGKVTIAEAKAAGFKMPITREHWLYKYMDDKDGDGMVGE